MSGSSYYALALFAALTVSSGAYARTTHHSTSFPPGAHASVAGTSEADVRKQCYDEARGHWGTNSQDMQTPREAEYRACMYDHGVHNP